MSCLHRYYVRTYPTLVSVWLFIAGRALALDVTAPDNDGRQPGAPARASAYEGMQVAIADPVATMRATFQVRDPHRTEPPPIVQVETAGSSGRIARGKDGAVSSQTIDSTSDRSAPALDVKVDAEAWAGERLHVSVDPLEPVREVFVSLPEVGKRRVRLEWNAATGRYEGGIRVPFEFPRDRLKVRVVARDLARNRVQHEIEVPVLFDGC